MESFTSLVRPVMEMDRATGLGLALGATVGLWMWSGIRSTFTSPPLRQDPPLRIVAECKAPKHNKVILHQMYGQPGASGSVSPACHKLEMFLRLAGIEHEVTTKDDFHGPVGKAPWIEHGRVQLGDSELIIRYLLLTFGTGSDKPSIEAARSISQEVSVTPATLGRLDLHLADLPGVERAALHALSRTIENHTYFAINTELFLGERNFETWKRKFPEQSGFPAFLMPPFAGWLRQMMHGALWGQGLGRHNLETVASFLQADAQALDEFLTSASAPAGQERRYFCGERPGVADCIIYHYLEMATVDSPYQSAFCDAVAKRPALLAYVRRVREEVFPDRPAVQAPGEQD